MQGVPSESGARDGALRRRRDRGRNQENEPAGLRRRKFEACDCAVIERLRHPALDDDKVGERWRALEERNFLGPKAGGARDACPCLSERGFDDVRSADEVRDEPAQRPVVDLFRRSDLNDHD